jgi:oligoribonuclease (3'-5' exoribonuclease)
VSREDVIFWLDLETTGSKSTESIIEVGILATDGSPELKPLGEFQSLVAPDPDNWRRVTDWTNDPARLEVQRMHQRSGLSRDIEAAKKADDLPSVAEVEAAILHFVRTVAGSSTDHIPLAGSGVSHFDRQFIRRDWPKFDKRLTYWAYDVGVMRRMLRLSGVASGLDRSRIDRATRVDLTHRALDDAKDHAQEARTYLAWLRDIEPEGIAA